MICMLKLPANRGDLTMRTYFLYDNYPFGPFQIFSKSHIMSLLTILLVNLIMVYWIKNYKTEHKDMIIRYTLATLLIVQEISLSVWRLSWGKWTPGVSLPLHLCGAAIVLSAIMLINKSYRLYEIVYFWGLGGAIQALLQPDIGAYSFPHYRFFQFFVSHGLIVTATIYGTFSFGYRPKYKSIFRIFLLTNIYMIFIAGFNYVFDGNYLFICHKPETASLLDFFGPWPWYILVLEGVALISFLIYYSPFVIVDMIKRRRIVKAAIKSKSFEY